MATPIIRSMTATPATLQPGQSARVDLDAYDPDARQVTLSGTVKDAAGHAATATTVLTVGDPLTYQLTCDDPTVTVTPDPAVPGRFSVTV